MKDKLYITFLPTQAVIPPVQLLLDAYPGATAAYSFRKLRNAYTGSCFTVRRSSDNGEIDIDFVNDYYDSAALLSYIGAGSGFITKWYDQSGNSRDAVQTSASIQPIIATSGVITTMNGLTAMSLNSQYLDLPNFNSFNDTTIFSVFGDNLYTLDSDNCRFYDLKDGTYSISLSVDGSNDKFNLKNSSWQTGIVSTEFTTQNAPTTQILTSAIALNASNDLYVDSSLQTKISANNTGSAGTVGKIGSRGDALYSTKMQGKYQEMIIYQSDKSADMAAIDTNIKSYYGIL